MLDEEDFTPISALQHYLYCPRQCALIHIEQLWAENRHTAEGRILHEQVDKPKGQRRQGVRTVTAMPLVHPALGMIGIADVVEFHSQAEGQRAYPIEYKRGRPKNHRADEVQLCAQALCLESMLGYNIPEGALFYGETRRRTVVVFDAELRQLTCQTLACVQAMLAATQTPIAVYLPRRCDTCSLIDLCQPRLLQRGKSVQTWLSQQLEE